MRFICKIKYKDKMITIFLKDTSLKYLMENCEDYMFDAFNLTYIFLVKYRLWKFIMDLLQIDD